MQAASYVPEAPDSPQPRATTPADHYRRRARKLRWVHAGHPDRLHPALAELARSHDAATREHPGRATHVERGPVEAATYSPAKAFAEQVTRAMDGHVLRYSERLALLRLADRQGLGRFEANLVIAAIQHRLRSEPSSDESHARGAAPILATRLRRRGVPAGLLVFAAVQSLIALGAWHVLG